MIVKGTHVTMRLNGVDLLGEVITLFQDNRIAVRYFNGESWPVEPLSTEVEALVRTYESDSVLKCDMEKDCQASVTHVDNRGFIYCTRHGERRKSDTPCRKLVASEIKRLEAGQTINYRR